MRKILAFALLLSLGVAARAQSATQKPDGPIRVSTDDGSVSFEGVREFVFPANQVRIVGRKATVFTKYGLASSDIPDLDAAKITTGLFARARLCAGTADATTFCRGDGVWAVPAAGEANTASNVGAGGVGVFKQKSGVDLQFKKLNAASTKVSVTDDTANSEVDLDVNQANLDRNALGGGALSVANGGTGATDAAGARASLGLGTAATRDVPASGDASASQVVKGDDTRLTDARAPTAHAHSAADVTSGALPDARIASAATWNAKEAAVTTAAYTAATLENSWVNFDAASWNPAGYYKDRGLVRLRGLVKNGTVGGGATVFTLPAGHCPALREIFVVISNGALGRVDVRADCGVEVVTANNAYLSLSGITFAAAP